MIFSENKLLSQLPKGILPNLKYTTQHESDIFVKNLLTTNLPKIDQNLDNEYYKNFLLLKHKVKNKTRKTEKVRKNKNYITRSEKNTLGIGKIHRNSFRYTDLIPLNNLWKKYFRDFLELDRYEKNKIPTPLDKNWDYFSTLLIKADYHGAIFTVIRSTCPSLIGHTGICVMETQNTLHIVDQKNITRSKYS